MSNLFFSHVWLALIIYAPASKNLKEHFERAFALFIISSFFFSKWLEPLFWVKI